MGFCRKCDCIIEGVGFCENCKKQYPKEFHEWKIDYFFHKMYYQSHRERILRYQKKYTLARKEIRAKYMREYKNKQRRKGDI